MSALLSQHQTCCQCLGLPATGFIFCDSGHPGQKLTTSNSILKRLNEVYFAAMAENGLDIPDGFKLSGHSFRRGGINAIRDAARLAGLTDDRIRVLLMRYGRWRDPRSVDIYLVESFEELANLTRRL